MKRAHIGLTLVIAAVLAVAAGCDRAAEIQKTEVAASEPAAAEAAPGSHGPSTESPPPATAAPQPIPAAADPSPLAPTASAPDAEAAPTQTARAEVEGEGPSRESAAAPAPQPSVSPASTPSLPAGVSDERIIECARSGTWGLGDCPTREQMVTRMSRAGQIAFTDPPPQMNLGDSYVIHVAAGVGDEMAVAAVREAAGSGQNIAQRNVGLLPSVEAELTGVGFDIRPLQSDGRQTLLSDRPNEWSWEVRPRQEGARRLTLTVWGLLSFGDERFPRIRVQTLRHDVNVTVSMPTRLRLAGEWAVSHWEASAGAGGALLALLTWMMTRLRRKPSESA